MDLLDFVERGGESYLPGLSVDLTIMGYEDEALKCLLLRIGDRWLLPGGYIGVTESVEHAAKRILRERTGLEDPHLKFLSVFGRGDRRFTGEWKEFFRKNGFPWREDYWFNRRYVTLAYYSLVHIEDMKTRTSVIDEEVAWFDMDNLPELWMDHAEIINTARERLKEDIREEHMTYNLLPDRFTMPELHQLHETILCEKLDRSRFQKKMLATGLFERLPRLQKDSPGRNPFLYRIKTEKKTNK